MKYAENTSAPLTQMEAALLVYSLGSSLRPQLWNLLSNYHAAQNTFDFAQKYLTMGIGEHLFTPIGPSNPQARHFLHQTLMNIKRKATKTNRPHVINFVNSYFRHPHADHRNDSEPHPENRAFDDVEIGGIGFIHTTINLGE